MIEVCDDCRIIAIVRRRDFEKQLRNLGFAPSPQSSGKGHTMWYGRGRGIPVPAMGDLIHDDLAEAILVEAEQAKE